MNYVKAKDVSTPPTNPGESFARIKQGTGFIESQPMAIRTIGENIGLSQSKKVLAFFKSTSYDVPKVFQLMWPRPSSESSSSLSSSSSNSGSLSSNNKLLCISGLKSKSVKISSAVGRVSLFQGNKHVSTSPVPSLAQAPKK